MPSPLLANHQTRRAGGNKIKMWPPRRKAEDPTIHQGPQPEEVDTPHIIRLFKCGLPQYIAILSYWCYTQAQANPDSLTHQNEGYVRI